MKLYYKLVHGYMVKTGRAPRWQQFHVTRTMQKPNSAVFTPLWWIKKQTNKKQETNKQKQTNKQKNAMKKEEEKGERNKDTVTLLESHAT